MSTNELKKILLETLHEYNTTHQSKHFCFLNEEERVILKDFIKMGRFIKQGVIISLAIGGVGGGFLILALWIGWNIVKVTGIGS